MWWCRCYGCFMGLSSIGGNKKKILPILRQTHVEGIDPSKKKSLETINPYLRHGMYIPDYMYLTMFTSYWRHDWRHKSHWVGHVILCHRHVCQLLKDVYVEHERRVRLTKYTTVHREVHYPNQNIKCQNERSQKLCFFCPFFLVLFSTDLILSDEK